MIQRYSLRSMPNFFSGQASDTGKGEWVKHADHKERVERLEAALRDLLKHTDDLRGESVGEVCPICEAARSTLGDDAGKAT